MNHAERSIQADTPAMAMLALHSAVRLGAAARVVDRLTELLVPMQGPLPGLIGAHARGAADRDGPALLTVADGFARLGFLPYGAEAAAQAAEIFAAQQGPGSAAARRATARATELSLQCQHLDSPAVQRLIAPELSTRERHLAPPSTVPQLVERHGLFDAAFGPQATRQTRDRMLALASRESGAFSDPVVPRPGGGTMPSPGLTVIDPSGSPATLPLPPGQALPAGQYLVHDTDNPVVPYLIDPGAGGATLAPVPGQPVTAGSAPVTVAYSGRWPDQVPAELRLVAGSAAGQERSPVLAADTAGRGALTVTCHRPARPGCCSARRSPPLRWT